MSQYKHIPLAPKGKARPRVTANGKRTFMPSAYTQWKKDMLMLHGAVEIDGPVALSIIAVRPMPKSWSAKKRDGMRGHWTTTTPDTDNIAGAVMDALLKDDSSVVALDCRKVWGDAAAMLVKVESADIQRILITQE